MSILEQELRPGMRVTYVGRGMEHPATVLKVVKGGVRISFEQPVKFGPDREAKVMSVHPKMLRVEKTYG